MSDASPPLLGGTASWLTLNASHVMGIARRLAGAFDPRRAVIFGSYARDEMHPGSDLDLLVVLPSSSCRRSSMNGTRPWQLSGLLVSKDIVVATPEEIGVRRNSIWSIVAWVLNDGITVCL